MLDQILMSDPAAQKLAGRLDPRFAALAQIPPRLATLCVTTRQQCLQIGIGPDGSQSLVAQALAEQQATVRNKALVQVDQMWTEAETIRSDIETEISSATATPEPDDPTLALLAETRESRAWHRLERRFDAATDPGYFGRLAEDVTREAAEAHDEISLAALADELPSYAAAKGWGISGVVRARLDDIVAATVPAVARMAARYQGQLTTSWPRLSSAFFLARRDLSGAAGASIAILPGWAPRTQYDVLADGTVQMVTPDQRTAAGRASGRRS